MRPSSNGHHGAHAHWRGTRAPRHERSFCGLRGTPRDRGAALHVSTDSRTSRWRTSVLQPGGPTICSTFLCSSYAARTQLVEGAGGSRSTTRRTSLRLLSSPSRSSRSTSAWRAARTSSGSSCRARLAPATGARRCGSELTGRPAWRSSTGCAPDCRRCGCRAMSAGRRLRPSSFSSKWCCHRVRRRCSSRPPPRCIRRRSYGASS